MPKTKILWPSMRYGPDNTYCIFEGPDEIPEGWTESLGKRKDYDPNKPLVKVQAALPPAEFVPDPVDLPPPPPAEGGEKEITDETVNLLADGMTNKEMVAMLERMQELDDNVEFNKNWPGAKLARAILENGGPLED